MKFFLNVLRLISVALLATLLGSCGGSAGMSTSGQHPDDRVRWTSTSGEPHLKITCPEGIGHLVVSRRQSWPSSILVSFPLQALEGLDLRADKQRHRLEITSDGQEILEPNMNNALSLVSIVQMPSGYLFTLRIDFDLLNTPDQQVLLSWVDFYR